MLPGDDATQKLPIALCKSLVQSRSSHMSFITETCHYVQETKLLSEEKLTEEIACVEAFEVYKKYSAPASTVQDVTSNCPDLLACLG